MDLVTRENATDRERAEVAAVARALAETHHGGIENTDPYERTLCWQHAATAITALDAFRGSHAV